MLRSAIIVALLAAPAALPAAAQGAPGTVLAEQKISRTQGGGGFNLDNNDQFGRSVVGLGDLDGDGVGDIVVGAHHDDDGGENGQSSNLGAVWVLFLNTDGTVKDRQKISQVRGGFTGDLDWQDQFGRAVGNIGDFDGDGVTDIAVGAAFDDDGGLRRGAVWLLYLNSDGTVKEHRKISATSGGFAGQLDDDDQFGRAVDAVGDLDGDGITELVVGAAYDDDGGSYGTTSNVGAVWILFMNADGTVKAHQKISATEGGFGGLLIDGDNFGVGAAGIGDLNGDGVPDLAVGEPKDRDGGIRHGAVWILFLNPNGTVQGQRKITDYQNGFDTWLTYGAEFGTCVSPLGDVDGDGVWDLAVGAMLDAEVGNERGAAYVLLMNPDGTVKGHQKINEVNGGFTGPLDERDWFGSAISGLGDQDGDGKHDMVVGARFDDDGGANYGAVYVLLLDGVAQASQTPVGSITPYGCGYNPENSLVHLSGDAAVGQRLTLGVDNPAGTQQPGSRAWLVLSQAPHASFPCGRLYADRGMDGPGELLISLSPGNRLRPNLRGELWMGPGQPAAVVVDVPDDPALAGLKFYAQGFLWDPSAPKGGRSKLAGAMELELGP